MVTEYFVENKTIMYLVIFIRQIKEELNQSRLCFNSCCYKLQYNWFEFDILQINHWSKLENDIILTF